MRPFRPSADAVRHFEERLAERHGVPRSKIRCRWDGTVLTAEAVGGGRQ